MTHLEGVIVALGTPLTPEDRVDERGLRKLTRHVLDAGVHGILVNGSMGGFAYLPDEEQLRAIEIVVHEASRAVPVMGGLGENGTVRAIAKARQIARLGVSHVSILPPFYFFASQEQLTDFFHDVAAAAGIPVVLYDNPVMTKNKIKPATIAELARTIPNAVGMKESDLDMAGLQEVLHLCRGLPGFSVLTGSEVLFHTCLRMGCAGGIGGLYNITPRLAVDLHEAFRAGDEPAAAALQRDLIEAWQLFTCGAIWGGFEEALRCLGICERAVGHPYATQLGAEEKKKVRGIVDKYVRTYAGAAI